MAEVNTGDGGGGHGKHEKKRAKKSIHTNRYDTHGGFGIPPAYVFRTYIYFQ